MYPISSVRDNLITNYSNLSTINWYLSVNHGVLVVIVVVNGEKLRQGSWCSEGLDPVFREPCLFVCFFFSLSLTIYFFSQKEADKG